MVYERDGVVEDAGLIAAAAHAAAVNDSAAVVHAVAAGAGGVVAPAHTARVQHLPTLSDSITARAGLSVATAHATCIKLLAAVLHTVAASARRIDATAHATDVGRCAHPTTHVKREKQTNKMQANELIRIAPYMKNTNSIGGVGNVTVIFDEDPLRTRAESTKEYLLNPD